METPEMAGSGRGVADGDGCVDVIARRGIRFVWFEDEPRPQQVHDSSPAVGSRLWWEGEACPIPVDINRFGEPGFEPWRPGPQNIPVSPEEDEAWERHAGST